MWVASAPLGRIWKSRRRSSPCRARRSAPTAPHLSASRRRRGGRGGRSKNTRRCPAPARPPPLLRPPSPHNARKRPPSTSPLRYRIAVREPRVAAAPVIDVFWVARADRIADREFVRLATWGERSHLPGDARAAAVSETTYSVSPRRLVTTSPPESASTARPPCRRRLYFRLRSASTARARACCPGALLPRPSPQPVRKSNSESGRVDGVVAREICALAATLCIQEIRS